MKGCIVLSLNKNKSEHLRDFYKEMFGGQNVFFGNTFSDKFSLAKASDIPLDTGVFSVIDDDFYEIPVPTKGSLVLSCFSGIVANKEEIDQFTEITDEKYSADGYYPNKLLIRLNSSKHGEKSEDKNYADTLYDRVCSKIKGIWAFTVAYVTLSGRTRIAIAKKDRDIMFHFITTNSFQLLVWTDEYEVFNELDERYYVYSMAPLANKDLLVIHPMYLIDKWKRWRKKYNQADKRQSDIMIIAILEKYLARMAR